MVSVLENDLGSKFPATSLLFYFRDDIFIYNVLLDLSLKDLVGLEVDYEIIPYCS